MSAPETEDGDPKPSSHEVPDSDPLAETLPDVPSDRKTESDTLTAANRNDGKALIEAVKGEGDADGASEGGRIDTEESEPPPPLLPSSEVGESTTNPATRDIEPALEADNSGEADVRTPAVDPVKTESPSESLPRQRRRRGAAKTGLELAIVAESLEIPEWLPPGWRMEDRVRGSGVTAGTKDRYFYDPVSGRQFRSKREVLCFMETGSSGRYKGKSKNKNTVDKPSESSGPFEQNGYILKKKMMTSSKNFDFVNPPAKVRWVLNSPAEGSWTPFIDGERLPESSKQEWAAAFTSLTRESGGTMFEGDAKFTEDSSEI